MADKQYANSYDNPEMCKIPEAQEPAYTQPEGNAAALGQMGSAVKKEDPLIDNYDIMDGVLIPLEFLAEYAPTLGAAGEVVDDTAVAMGSQAAGVLGVLGGAIGITEGIHGIHKLATNDKDDNAADLIPSLGHLASGGMSTVGGIAAVAGVEGGLAALGPLGAAVAAGSFLGKHAGEMMWELDQKLSAGSHQEEAQESYVQPEERALFNILEGNWDKVLDSVHLF